MRKASLLLVCLVAAAAAAAVPSASAGTPEEDFAAVYRDWERDQRITPCRFREPQLQNAYDVATSDPDLIYTGFPSAVEREIARWRSGGCAAVLRDSSPLAGVQVARVRGRGRASREIVVLRNTTGSTKRLDGARLRNRRGRSVTLPRGVRLAGGRSLTVTIGCPAGRRRPGTRGSRAWTCSRRELFADGGDVARLLDRAGVVVSQRGFGSRAGDRAF